MPDHHPAAVTPPGLRPLPDYLHRTYAWAYLNRRTLPWLDRGPVVSAILWGNARRLMQGAVAEFGTGQAVLQAACVYGDFSARLARQVGRSGRLEVVDVAPLQVANARRKLAPLPQARARVGDLTHPLARTYDGVCCFFLLHEVPEHLRRRVVDNLLAAVAPGGKAVFVDYHRPAPWHPLGPIMDIVFRHLEPYAPSLLDAPIAALSPRSGDFAWHRRTLFGGLYQHVVAVRPVEAPGLP
jgi:SAM-dependent methyltransferase